MTPCTIHYLRNLVWNTRQVNASNMAQGLTVESVSDRTVRRTLREADLYGQCRRRKLLLTKMTTARLNATECETEPVEYWQHIFW